MQRPQDLGTAPPYSFLMIILLVLSSWLGLVSEFSAQPSTPRLEADRLSVSTTVQRDEPGVSSALKPLGNVLEPVGKVDAPATRPRVDDPRPEPPKNSVTPPSIFKGIYLSFWSTTVKARVDRVIELARNGMVNAIVIDVKDATGRVGFNTRVPEATVYQARHRTTRDLGTLVGKLQAAGLYVIARMVVFTDPKMASARPELAVHSKSKLSGEEPRLSEETLWLDNRKLAWLDPSATEVWDYNVAIAKDVLRSGVDELNFDYIRFPSDGTLTDMYFPVWRGKTPRRQVIRSFFAHLRQELPDARLSADLFGLATVNRDDLGVGQVIEDAYPYFDYVCPMVYPSLYAVGFRGFENPAAHPYEVVSYSMKKARERLLAFKSSRPSQTKLRPWLQDFDRGAAYDVAMVKKQIQAAQEALGEDYGGFTLWSPTNVYSTAALR